MHEVCISIGSNMGDRQKNCAEALRLMQEKGIRIIKTSGMYETEPWGVEDQPVFINMAAAVGTELGPKSLLNELKMIEKCMGRTGSFKWGPRIIDLDIIFYDDIVMDMPGLKIPHNRAHERRFVLEPLAEIAPGKIHPLLNKSVKTLLEELDNDQNA
ncbi:MAG: 2-amino-4-hydroxy-6-hydroxymethyldihydropteridine diphosphokinase [Nitrospiraceae bacterium]|nr:2-amino-4-hydroxy-6-hydroxymethyldihydropteridine diphosphokinase [Nitrospiraceae bacterium]